MKILITGTHLTPAQAVIKQLDQNDNDIVYVGRGTTMEGDKSKSVESQVLKAMGVRFIPLIAGRVRRDLSFYTIVSLFKIPIGFIQAFYILLIENPDVILSFGGYVAVPLVFWGYLFSKPIMVHEQTLVPGLANIFSSFFATKIALSFKKNNYKNQESKVIMTGNPIRELVINPSGKMTGSLESFFKKSRDKKLPLILITGGNQGSHIINKIVEETLEELTDLGIIIHQTGDSKYRDYDLLKEKNGKLPNGDRYFVTKWINEEDFGNVLPKVDLAVSRAGINTLLELALKNVRTIVIPLPGVFRDEQTVNASYFEKNYGFKFVSQKDLSGDRFLNVIKSEIRKPKEKSSSKSLVNSDAAKILALETLILGEQNLLNA